MNEHSKISSLKGIGEKTEKIFQKAGIFTVGDLVHYYPRGYEVYEEPVTVSEAPRADCDCNRHDFWKSPGGWQSRNADYDTLFKGSDGNVKGNLVSNAVSPQYPVKRRSDHASRTNGTKKGRTGYGASRKFFIRARSMKKNEIRCSRSIR